MDKWLTALLIWYGWITASSILMIVAGWFSTLQYMLALTYLALPTFAYFVYHAKKKHDANKPESISE